MTSVGLRSDARLRLVADKQEIHETFLTYCRAVDRGDRALLATVFAPDATVDTSGSARPWEEVADTIASIPPGMMLCHFIGNHLIQVQGNGATGEAYAMAVQLAPVEESAKHSWRLRAGRYLTQFVRIDDRWLIASTRIVDDWTRVDEIVQQAGASGSPVGSRSTTDPSYEHRGRR